MTIPFDVFREKISEIPKCGRNMTGLGQFTKWLAR